MSIKLGPIFNSQNNKVREWSITISLFNEDDTQVDITSPDMAIKEGQYATYSTLSGYVGMKMTTSSPTIVRSGKNLGKKNETTVLTQALKESQSKHDLKIKSGYTSHVSHTELKTPQHPFPMAVKPWKDHKKKLVYPLYIQPKLDGVRMLAKYENGKVVLLTRRLHDIVGFERIKQDLKQMFDKSKAKTFYIDGELYAHGMNLQSISGIVRNESIDESQKESLQYHVFDCFDVGSPEFDFEERIEFLRRFVKVASSPFIVFNNTFKADDEIQADGFYKEFIKEGYEGAIYKSKHRPYEFDFNKEKRSSWYLKRKKQEDAEYPIIGFSQGKGKDLGCIVFQLQGPNNKTFNSVPNGTYEYRKALYQHALQSFNTSFNNKLAKVVFDDLSKDGVPLRGRIVQIGRDLSFD